MKLKVVLLSLLLALSLNANESRKGFFWGFSGGVSSSNIYGQAELETIRGIDTTLEIGYGISEDVLVYYSDGGMITSNDSALLSLGMGALGVSYYINKNSYIKTAIGMSGLFYTQDISSQSDIADIGLGFSLGYGYLLSPKSSLDLDLSYGNLIKQARLDGVSDMSDIDLRFSSIAFSYKYRFF